MHYAEELDRRKPFQTPVKPGRFIPKHASCRMKLLRFIGGTKLSGFVLLIFRKDPYEFACALDKEVLELI